MSTTWLNQEKRKELAYLRHVPKVITIFLIPPPPPPGPLLFRKKKVYLTFFLKLTKCLTPIGINFKNIFKI